jgi:hypothetical protein
VRHALGALLLEQGHTVEAEVVYREDLGLGGNLPRAQIHPDNVWSLRGLNACLTAQGAADTPEGRHIAQRLALAEARADPKPKTYDWKSKKRPTSSGGGEDAGRLLWRSLLIIAAANAGILWEE